MSDEPEVLFEKRGAAGIVTLNRPKALNALTHGMVVAMKTKLDDWASDEDVGIVVVRGAGERAFCAGGDIRAIAESGRVGTNYALDFWHDEYIVNAAIKHYPKPYMALIHGIVMGGGVGVSVHGQYRIVCETTLFAMPETGIGFFPDVGGSYFLPRCPGETGMYLALTGARLKAVDAVYVGVATHFVTQEVWPNLINALAEGQMPGNVLSELGGYSLLQRNLPLSGEMLKEIEELKKKHAPAGFLYMPDKDIFSPPPPPPLTEHREKIDRIFAADSVEAILAGLDAETDDWSRGVAATIRTKSPTSLKLTFREMHEGKNLSFDDCMRMEYRMASRILAGHDFYEGVRAAIVDKDGAPKWHPATLAEVKDEAIDAYFEPLGEKELKL